MSIDIEKARPSSLWVEGVCYTREDLPKLHRLAHDRGRRELAELSNWLEVWWGGEEHMDLLTSGSTGTPKQIQVRKAQMIISAEMTCRTLSLEAGQTALLCMNLSYIGAQMMVVRAMVWGLNLIVRPASSHPFVGITERIHFASMVPLQVEGALSCDAEAELLAQVNVLLIGGSPVEATLEERLAHRLRGRAYSSYGMTETLSHIALRPIGGNGRYYPLSGVSLGLSGRQTLTIEAPYLLDTPLETNDIVDIAPDGGFVVLGRVDDVINSGGVKVHPQRVEALLGEEFAPSSLLLTSIPEPRLGEALVLLLELSEGERADMCAHLPEGSGWVSLSSLGGCVPLGLETEEVWVASSRLMAYLKGQKGFEALPPYHEPKYILGLDRLPRLGNGKPDRLKGRRLLEEVGYALVASALTEG